MEDPETLRNVANLINHSSSSGLHHPREQLPMPSLIGSHCMESFRTPVLGIFCLSRNPLSIYNVIPIVVGEYHLVYPTIHASNTQFPLSFRSACGGSR